jgi:RNA-binding protein FUS
MLVSQLLVRLRRFEKVEGCDVDFDNRGGYGDQSRDDSKNVSSHGNEADPKVKQCDENCGDTCDNTRIYISGLPLDVKEEELRELFGGIGQVARLKQKRGYKDQWPWNIKIYTDESGKNKGDAVLSYEDPSAAHSAGGFFNDYEMRGHKIKVTMAAKSAPKAPPMGGGGFGGGGFRGGHRGGGGPDRREGGGYRPRPY